ncbi:MAG: GAF domain-containing protein [Lentisphaeria bacterium]|nr:GAF domain-containing protein [Lentisphaeria bacterium]
MMDEQTEKINQIIHELENLRRSQSSSQNKLLGKDLEILLANFLGQIQPLEETNYLQTFLHCAMYATKAGGAGLTLYDTTIERLVFRAAVGDGSDKLCGVQVPLKNSVHGLVYATGEAQATTPIYKDIDEETKQEYKNVMVAPLLTNNEVIGTISVVNKIDDDSFSLSDLKLFEDFAKLAAILIEQYLQHESLSNAVYMKDNKASTQHFLNKDAEEYFNACKKLNYLRKSEPKQYEQILKLLND